MADSLIEIEAVSRDFVSQDGGTLRALDAIDLAIREHELVSLVGPSGAENPRCFG